MDERRAPEPQSRVREPERLDIGLSVALDVLRFGASLAVLFGHVTGRWLTGGLLWQLGGYHHDAVIIFFVLSGYVIAATTSHRRGAGDYMAARLSRLLSVVFPALVVTFALDRIGLTLNPGFYLQTAVASSPGFDAVSDLPARAIANLLLVQEWWVTPLMHRAPGSNGPFWSLSYEASYYAAFGLLLFLKGWRRWVALALLFALTGPRILLLAPLWLLGAGLWRLRGRVDTRMGWPLLAAGVALYAAYALNRVAVAAWDTTVPGLGDFRLGERYLVGLATAMAVMGLSLLSPRWRLERTARPIRRVADHTFELYVLHIPVALLMVAVLPFSVGDPRQVLLVYGGIALAVMLTARLATPLRGWLRRWLLSALRECNPIPSDRPTGP